MFLHCYGQLESWLIIIIFFFFFFYFFLHALGSLTCSGFDVLPVLVDVSLFVCGICSCFVWVYIECV
jgi:hypothetical protein